MSTPAPKRRYHSLDCLRASMMMLGLVLHSAINYMPSPTEVWSFRDPSTNGVFDWVVFLIHVFRMPVFFMVAGFFAAFLFYKRGSGAMTKNRLLRVFVPLVIGWIVLVPLVYSGFQFALAGGGREGLAAAKAFFQDGPLYPNLTLSHLWFLWDLLIFYAAAIVIMALVKRMPENFRKSVLDLFGRLALSIWGLVALILISWITLMPMTYAGLNTSTSLFPPVRILVAYGVFFGFGWLLFNRKELVDTFPQRGWMNLIAGTLFGIAYYHFVFRVPLFADPDVLHLFGTGLCAATMWLLTYGFMGVFVRYLDGARPWVRYMSDASYWIYLVHLPLTIWLPGLLVGTAFPATAKFVIVLCGTTLITVLSYHYFVRSTAIGLLLNGRKYPRALPKYDAAGELVKAR